MRFFTPALSPANRRGSKTRLKHWIGRQFKVPGLSSTNKPHVLPCFGNSRNSRSVGYPRWGFQAKKHFGLFVLDYMVTSNHIHFLVKDTATNVIAQSMQLIAGRTAQEYNQRKNRQGAFWEDRYHATAIEADEHVHRCLVYILARWKPRGRTAASP